MSQNINNSDPTPDKWKSTKFPIVKHIEFINHAKEVLGDRGAIPRHPIPTYLIEAEKAYYANWKRKRAKS